MAIDSAVPSRPAKIANTRYIVPMSLWFVELSHRVRPVGRSDRASAGMVMTAPHCAQAKLPNSGNRAGFVWVPRADPSPIVASRELGRRALGRFERTRIACGCNRSLRPEAPPLSMLIGQRGRGAFCEAPAACEATLRTF